MTSEPMKLYEFQQEGVDFLIRSPRALLADDMGLGKTIQAIATCKEISARLVLVVCPNVLKDNWAIEINKWDPEKDVTVLRGSYRGKLAIIDKLSAGYLILNIESVQTRKDKYGNKYSLTDNLLLLPWDVLIVDEAHSIKNRNANQTKGIYKLACNIKRVYLLTGTPIMNRVDELWSPLNILYPVRYASFWSFVKRHAIVYRKEIEVKGKTRLIWMIDGKPVRPKELKADIAPIFLRREKKQVFPQMPDMITQKIWLELEGEQLQIYKDVMRKTLVEINKENVYITIPGILARLTRCRQAALSPKLLGGKTDGIKLDVLTNIIKGTDQKLIVFSQFAEAIKLVSKILEKEGIGYSMLIGETLEKHRNECVTSFQTLPEIKAFLTTTQAGGAGLTLTAANLVIFLDKHWTPAINEQAINRTRPHLQQESVQVIELLGLKTVDVLIEKVLSGKISIVEAIVKMNIQPVVVSQK